MPPAGVTLASGLGRELLLLAVALHPSLLPSPCRAARGAEALPPPVSAAVCKLPACPQPAAQQGHRVWLPAAQACWARKQRHGLVYCRKPSKPSSYGTQGHGSWEQNAKRIHAETALMEHFCTDICRELEKHQELESPCCFLGGTGPFLVPKGVQ